MKNNLSILIKKYSSFIQFTWLNKSNQINLIFLFVLFLITELIINPIGNFPLNDDWVYSKALLNLNTQNNNNWGCTTMVAQLYYAQMFVSAFGFSFTLLRFSTLIIAIFGISTFYLLCEQHFKLSKIKSFFAAALLLYNPLFLSLSNSFMTDVPFLCSAIFGFYFYFNYYNSKKYIQLALSIFFFSCCILTRQLGVAFVVAIFISELIFNIKSYKKNLLFIIFSLLPLIVFEYWFKTKVNMFCYKSVFFKDFNSIHLNEIIDIGVNFLKRWIHYISFTGLVLSPILISYLYHLITSKQIFKNRSAILKSIILLLPVVWSFQKFPIGNYLYNCGVGPNTLYDTYILKLNIIQNQSFIIFSIITIISFISSFTLIYAIVLKTELKITASKNTYFQFPNTTVLISIILYYSFLAIPSAIFDRYIFIVSAFLIPILLHENLIKHKLIALILFICLAIFSTLATKDNLKNNSVKWEAVNYLKINNNINDSIINAGYEHAGLVNTEKSYLKWTNNPKNKFIISQGNIEGYYKIKYFTYQRYVPFRTDTLFILKTL